MALTGKFDPRLFIGAILLVLACVAADLAHFVTPWPLNAYVFLAAILLFLFGGFTFVFGVAWSRHALANWFRSLKVADFVPIILAAGLIVYLNAKPRVSTHQHYFSDAEIVVVTHWGWPFALWGHEHVTRFEEVESLRFSGPQPRSAIVERTRMQKEFSREAFVDRPTAWSVNFLHWVLI